MTTSDNEQRNKYMTRDSVMKLLSNEEVANVASAETDIRLADGEEYLDLWQLEQGVQRSSGVSEPMGSVLPKKTVRDATWSKILVLLAAPNLMKAHSAT